MNLTQVKARQIVPFLLLLCFLTCCARLGEGSESADSGTPATHHDS